MKCLIYSLALAIGLFALCDGVNGEEMGAVQPIPVEPESIAIPSEQISMDEMLFLVEDLLEFWNFGDLQQKIHDIINVGGWIGSFLLLFGAATGPAGIAILAVLFFFISCYFGAMSLANLMG